MTLLLPGAAELLAARAGELPQKNGLCGAFWGLLALRGATAGDRLDQDAVGALAVVPATRSCRAERWRSCRRAATGAGRGCARCSSGSRPSTRL